MNKSRSIIALDLVRAAAALLVLLGHVRGATWVDYASLPAAQHALLVRIFFAVTRLGHEAVMVFFVLSGFLVGGRLIDRLRVGNLEPKVYIADRTTRILLPLAPACLLAALTTGIQGVWPPITTLLGNMVGLNDVLVPTLPSNGSLWSLSYEIWFYVLAGGVSCLLAGRGVLPATLAMGAALLVFTRLDASYFLFWAVGGLARLLLDRRRLSRYAAAGMALFAAGILVSQLSKASTSHALLSVPERTTDALICIGFSLMIPWLCSSPVDRWLTRSRPLASAGSAFSYSLYLTHAPVLAVVALWLPISAMIDTTSLLAFGVRVVASLLAAVVFYALFERPTPRLRAWLTARPMAAGGTGGLEEQSPPIA